ncbi:MAG: hypothetical protein HY557_08690 [Euryarchaeota archaeon]|nr:hypothetical protein [Euryarchaeota archaeon]
MADMFMMGSIGVGAVNAILAATLLAVYGRTYRATRAPFTLALLVFAAAFLLQNVLLVYAYVTMMPLLRYELTPYLFGVGAFEAGGLGAILWTATR